MIKIVLWDSIYEKSFTTFQDFAHSIIPIESDNIYRIHVVFHRVRVAIKPILDISLWSRCIHNFFNRICYAFFCFNLYGREYKP